MLANTNLLYRFDIVEVVAGKDGPVQCEIITNAFTPPDSELR